MLIFFLFVSLANLALGYFLAVKFHAALFVEPECERELVRPSSELIEGTPDILIDASQLPLVYREPLVVLPPERIDASPASKDLSAPVAETPAESDTPHFAPGLDAEPATALNVGNSAGFVKSSPGLEEISMDDFMQGLSDFRAKLSALDQRVKQCAKSPDSRQIEGCVQEFRAANNQYLEHSTEVQSRLEQLEPSESLATHDARLAVQTALESQAAEVRRTEDTLSQLDIAADPTGSCQAILDSSQELAQSSEKLGSELQLATSEFGPAASDSVCDESAMDFDELTQIPSRAMFDVELRKQRKRGGPFCLALVDIDKCGQLNEAYGKDVTDEMIKVMAQIVAASSRGECRAGRYSSQQFAVLYPNYAAADAALAVERIRQIIQHTEFTHGGQRIAVSVSVTLTSSDGSETPAQLEQRLSEGVRAGKAIGINQSFQFDGGVIKPIVQRELDLESNLYEV